jgi:hypothetical protein
MTASQAVGRERKETFPLSRRLFLFLGSTFVFRERSFRFWSGATAVWEVKSEHLYSADASPAGKATVEFFFSPNNFTAKKIYDNI